MHCRLLFDDRPLSDEICSSPCAREIEMFAASICTMVPSDAPVMVPVAVLRFTQHHVNVENSLGDPKQVSIFDLVEDMFHGRVEPAGLELDVFLHSGPDGVRALYSRSNHRLFALLCHQAVRRDSAIMVPCRIYADNDDRPSSVPGMSFAQLFRSNYDQFGIRPHCTGLGFSVWPPALSRRETASLMSGEASDPSDEFEVCESLRSLSEAQLESPAWNLTRHARLSPDSEVETADGVLQVARTQSDEETISQSEAESECHEIWTEAVRRPFLLARE